METPSPSSCCRSSGERRARQGAAADHAEGEPGALLVREGDDLDRIVGLDTTFLHRLRDLDAGEHAERPVEVPAVVHGVDVRADEDGRSVGIPPLPAAEEVPDGVLADREASLFHKGGDEVLGGPLFFREREPGHAARLLFAYLRKLREPAPQPLAVYHLCTTSGFSSFNAAPLRARRGAVLG